VLEHRVGAGRSFGDILECIAKGVFLFGWVDVLGFGLQEGWGIDILFIKSFA